MEGSQDAQQKSPFLFLNENIFLTSNNFLQPYRPPPPRRVDSSRELWLIAGLQAHFVIGWYDTSDQNWANDRSKCLLEYLLHEILRPLDNQLIMVKFEAVLEVLELFFKEVHFLVGKFHFDRVVWQAHQVVHILAERQVCKKPKKNPREIFSSVVYLTICIT